MAVQASYDVYTNDGNEQFKLRRRVQNNPEVYPYSLGPADYGAQAWTIDPLDVNSNTMTAWGATGTQIVVEMSVPVAIPITGIGMLIGTTAAGTPVSFCGFGIYSIGSTTATLLGSTADNHASGNSWAASGWQTTNLQSALTASQVPAGKYYLSAIVHATTMPTTTGAAIPASVAHSTGFNGVTVPARCATNGVQASFPNSITISSLSAVANIPFMVAY